MGPRERPRGRTVIGAVVAVLTLSVAGVAIASPQLWANPGVARGGPPAPLEGPAAGPVLDRDARPRATTPVGDPAVRADYPVDKPNVVVVMADDMRVDDVRFMPTVRRELAQGGVQFRNAFSPNPLCCPARASFYSGQYSHNHGVLSHVPPWGFRAFRDRATIGTALQRAGYRTALVGKYLNGYGEQRRRNGAPSLRYVPPGWSDWYAAFDWPVGSRNPGGTYNYLNQPLNRNGTLVRDVRGRYSTTTTGDVATRLIDRYAAGSKPFFLHLAFVAPHFGGPHEPDDPSYVLPDGRRERLGTPYVPPGLRGHFDRVLQKAPGLGGSADPSERDVADKPAHMRAKPDLNRSMRRATLESARQRAESLLALDRQVARVVARLKQRGEWGRTVLFFTSDNGFLLGEHRLVKGKIKPYEPSTRVPLLVTGPGLRDGSTRSDPITLVDLTATILELGRAVPFLTADHPLDGSSRLPTLLEGDQGWTAPVVTEGRLWPVRDPQRRQALGFRTAVSYVGIRTPRYSYVRYDRGPVELYDHLDDANQLVSRHRDPAYAEVLAQLRQVWTDYAHCAGPECRLALPGGLVAGPRDNTLLTNEFWRQVRERAAATLAP